MHTFNKDQVVFRNSIPYRFVRSIESNVQIASAVSGIFPTHLLQLENAVTGLFSTHTLEELLEEYVSGALWITPKKVYRNDRNISADNATQRMSHMSDASKAESRRRIEYIVKLNDQHVFDLGRKKLRQAILEISQSRNEIRAPHYTTIYRWRKHFLKAQQSIGALLTRIEERGGKGKSRLDPIVEGIIHEKIESAFLNSKSGSAEDVHSAVFLAVQLKNTERVESQWLKVPGLRTIQRRIERLYGYDITVAKFGQKEADRRYQYLGASRKVSRILEIVEIDHTPVDIMVANEKRIVIGRPTITVIMDRFSRCILGYNLTLSDHGVPGVFEALRHALLPKTYISERYPDLNLGWECFGWIEKLLMDNGREFHSCAVADALMSLGIITEFSASRTPNDKPFIERFLKTFNYSFIHKLPGTTLSKLHQRIGFKAEDDACLTLEELDKLVHAWILGIYHLRPHIGLGKRAPIDVWRENAILNPPRLKANSDDIEIEFSEVATSRVQKYGIDLNNQIYASPELTNLRGALPIKDNSVDVKWPRSDLGHIFVWNPFESTYFKVPNIDEEKNGLTLDQVKLADKVMAENPEYKKVRAKMKDVVREMGNEASEDKKLKTRKSAERFKNKSTKNLHKNSGSASQIIPTSTDNTGTIEDFEVPEYDIDTMTDKQGAIS